MSVHSPTFSNTSHGNSSLHRRTPSRAAVSMPRELSQTPSIGRVGSMVQPPHIQKCVVIDEIDLEHPLETMRVVFEEDGLAVTTDGLLGKGGFGKVFFARSDGGEKYALKVSSKKMSEGDWKRLNEEVILMSHFSRHPNIVRFVAAGHDDDRAYVLMEQCTPKSLHDVIVHHSLDVAEILWIGWSLVNTVLFLHSKGCIHRDIKTQNLLFDFQGNLKITDFGLSSRISDNEPRKTVAGTAMYMAPEMAQEVYKRLAKTGDNTMTLSYGKEVDTWSIGVVLFVLLTRTNPYLKALAEKRGNSGDKKDQLVVFSVAANASWSWPDGWNGDAGLRRLVEGALDKDRNRRSTLQDLVEDPVWNRRPLSCPASLLRKLDIAEPSPQRSPLSHMSSNTAAGNGKQRSGSAAGTAAAQALHSLENMENRGRVQIVLEYQQSLNIMVGMLQLLREERDARSAIVSDEVKEFSSVAGRGAFAGLSNRRTRRAGSVSLLSPSAADASSSSYVTVSSNTVPSQQRRGGSRSTRNSVSVIDSVPEAALVRASPDQYAVVYPGRESATRWGLRSVVSLPRELNEEIEQEIKCANRHVMTKLTSMPRGYEGFDCDVCGRGILTINANRPAYRCYKCDYDICAKCAFSGRFKEVMFLCTGCNKRFPTDAKLRAHEMGCRGPSVSVSPSPRRSSRRNTMLWEQEDAAPPMRRSLLEVDLPDAKPRGRATYARTSAGGRISLGGTDIPSPESFSDMVKSHTDANFPKVSTDVPNRRAAVASSSAAGASTRKVGRRSSSRDSLSLELPPKVVVSEVDGRPRPKLQPRSSEELRELLKDSPVIKNNPLLAGPATPPTYNEKGVIIGVAARRRAESLEMVVNTCVNIRADNAEKPADRPRQRRVPRSASSSRATAAPATTSTTSTTDARERPQQHEDPTSTHRSTRAVPTPSVPLSRPPVAPLSDKYNNNSAWRVPPPPAYPQQPQQQRAAITAVPLRGPGAPPVSPAVTAASSSSVPRSAFPGVPNSAAFTGVAARRPRASPSVLRGQLTAGGVPLGSPSGAFIAMPRERVHRDQFIENFLRGGWVRFYKVLDNEYVAMFYCLQPGRYGAIFPTEDCEYVATAVLDVHSKMVLYVPSLSKDTTNRTQPHPHVQTYYDDEVFILSLEEAQRRLGKTLAAISAFADECCRLRAEGQTPAAVPAAYVHDDHENHVPRDTKFVYLRRIFPDPHNSFVFFRLSNLRSQAIFPKAPDVRWQSDRSHNVGSTYYVHSDGSVEPFDRSNSGAIHQITMVLSNTYRNA